MNEKPEFDSSEWEQVSLRKTIHFSGDCNNLADTLRALLVLCGVNGFDMIPISPREFMKLVGEAQKHGTTALLV